MCREYSSVSRFLGPDRFTAILHVNYSPPPLWEYLCRTIYMLTCYPSFTVAAKVQTAALRGWSLLLTTLPAWQLTAPDIERQLASLADLLESPDVEVRSAAGEAVALLFHTYGLAELDAGDPTDSGYTRCGSP